MKAGGRLVDRLGTRLPAVAGIACMAAGTAALAAISTSTPAWVIALVLCLQGGYGVASVGVSVAAMSDLAPEVLAHASTLRNLANQVGGAVSVAGFAALLTAVAGSSPTAAQSERGFGVVFLTAGAMLGLAAAGATRLGEAHGVAVDLPPESFVVGIE
jgi:MFS family permease